MTKSTPQRTALKRRARSKDATFFNRSGRRDSGFFHGKSDGASVTEGCVSETIRWTDSASKASRGSGERLPKGVEQFFARKLQADLSDVCVHQGSDAAPSAEAHQAQAYAAGNAIVFNAGKYDPYSDAGRRLLSHELVHVVQQRENPESFGRVRCMPKDGNPEADAEKEKPAAAVGPAKDEVKPASVPLAGDEKAAAVHDEKAAASKEEKVAAPMPLPNFSVFGKPGFHADFAQNVTFSGRTDATFDGGKGHTENLKAVPATDCKGCGGGDCITATGSLVIDYHVSTTVNLPEVPSGLTPCQQKRVRDTINNVLKPHEDQHVAAFQSYIGTVRLPINYTGCKDGLQAHVQSMIDADSAARETAAKAKSAALDPFVVNVDLDCEEPRKSSRSGN